MVSQPDGTLDRPVERQLLSTDLPRMSGRWNLDHARWSQHFPARGTSPWSSTATEIDRQSFEVTTGPGVPEIRVTQGDTYIIDGRTTPIDFGTARRYPAAVDVHDPESWLRRVNDQRPGIAARLLAGRRISGQRCRLARPPTLPCSSMRPCPAQNSASFASAPTTPTKGNSTSISRDWSAARLRPGLAADRSRGTGRGLHQLEREPQLIAATATVSDSDSTNFNSGSSRSSWPPAATPTIAWPSAIEGTAAGQIGTVCGMVTFGGVPIGSFTGGEGTTPLVITFNANATLPAVQALVRNLTFANVSPQPATNHRYVRLTLVDDTGKTSNLAIAHVVVDPRPAPIPAASPNSRIGAVTPARPGGGSRGHQRSHVSSGRGRHGIHRAIQHDGCRRAAGRRARRMGPCRGL